MNGNLLATTMGGAAALAAYAFFVRPRHLRWGATNAELEMSLRGDELVKHLVGCKMSNADQNRSGVAGVEVWEFGYTLRRHR